MRMLLMAGALLLAASGAFAQRNVKWKTVTDSVHSCVYRVPPDWDEDSSRPGIAKAPDEKSTIVPVSMPDSFPDAKKAAAQRMPPLKVLQDSPQRYWFVYRDPADGEDSPDTHWFVVVPGKNKVCAVQITFRSAFGDSLLERIMRSIKTTR